MPPTYKRTGQSKRDKARRSVELGEFDASQNPYFLPFVPRVPSNNPNDHWNEAQKRKRNAIEMVTQGTGESDICRALGIQPSTFEFWTRDDGHFAGAIAYAEVQSQYALPDNWSAEDGEFHAKGAVPGFAGFRRRYFGMKSYYHHVRIIKAIEDAKPMSVTLILCPPEAGKTTVIGDYINYRIAMNPNIRITLVSEGQGHAEKILGRVQRRMTEPHLAAAYIKDFGPFEPVGTAGKPWTGTHFTVEKADHDEADFTLEARGASSSIYGTRTDLLIFDDIQSRKNLNQTEKLLASIRQDFLSRPGKEGRTIFVGTRVDVGDVYEALYDQGVIDEIVSLPATNPVEVVCTKALKLCELAHENCCGLHWPDGRMVPHEESLIPELWDSHSYAVRRKQVTDPVWLRSYQQRPQAAGAATFSEEMREGSRTRAHIGDIRGEGLVALGLDLALGGQNALIACDLNAKRMDVIDLQVDEGLGRVEQIIYRVQQFAEMYHPQVLICETDTLQKGIARDERLRELADQHGFLIHEHRTAGQKADAILGVSMMAGSFSRGEIGLCWGDPYAERRMAVLDEELAAWRPTIATKNLKQDTVMALWFVWRYWMNHKLALASGAGASFTRQLPKQFARIGTKSLQMRKRTA